MMRAMEHAPKTSSGATSAGRPRDTRIDEAVLAAARDLVAEVGYADLTLRAIAERARTSVPAIRRRWPSKAHLVHEAVYPTDVAVRTVPVGDLESELREMVLGCLAIVGSPAGRRATPGLISDLVADPDLQVELSSRLRPAVWETMAERLTEAAHAQGRDDVDVSLCVETVFGTTMMAVVLRGPDGVDEAWVDRFVRTLVEGLGAAR